VCGGHQKSNTNTIEFVRKAQVKHSGKYNYDHVVYANTYTKVQIICPRHGEFQQFPHDHLKGHGCHQCARNYKSNTQKFIAKSRIKHDDKYTYEFVEYINSSTKVQISCPRHGEFSQSPNSHLSGHGCPHCNRKARTSNTEEFITKARAVHGDKFTYESVDYDGARKKVQIGCPRHGEFQQTPCNHLQGYGCPQCGTERTAVTLLFNTQEFIAKARAVHGDKYNYDDVVYTGSAAKVRIICPRHGEFQQVSRNHLQGRGCPVCGGSQKSNTVE
jgi:Zn finger protein HypA/HybF involved in hydrogenase expression